MKKILNLNKESVLIFFLSYTAFSLPQLITSPLFSFWKLGLSIFIFAIGDKFWISIFKESERGGVFFGVLLHTFCFLFFFGFLLLSALQNFINEHTIYGVIRGQYIFGLIVLFFFVLQICFLKKRTSFIKYTNTFLIIFFIVSLASSISKVIKIEVADFKESDVNKTTFSNMLKSNSSKSVLLLVADEYSSPNELFKVLNDSSAFSFSDSLRIRGWIVRNNFHSKEISTIHSIASLLNMNMSNDNFLKNKETFLVSEHMANPILLNNLKRKGVEFLNLSIFDIQNTKALTELYSYPKSFTELLFSNTVYFLIERRIKHALLDTKYLNITMAELHNKRILNELESRIAMKADLNSFIYAHLYMPHSPIRFNEEISYDKYTIENYYEYWKFTNKKIDKLLKSLCKSNRYKIILTGDHGFRSDARINPNSTFASFYGFKEEEIFKIESVQDIGLVVDSSFY